MSFKGRERSGRPESDRDSDHSSQDGAFDKKIQSSRLYIGFLSDRVTKADLEEKFSKYGRVSGVSMQKGFAFLQFGHEDEATEAIKQENGAMFKGNRIEVAHAFESKRRSGRGGRRSSPVGDRNFRDRGRYQRKDVKDDSRNFDSGRDYFRRKYEDTYYRDRRDNLRDPGSDILHSYYKDLVLDPKRPNDCEIIVVDKAYRLYAESVERRLVNLGMLVDMVFPKDGAFVSQIVDDITRRGSLFAIVISQQHEAHNSVTLNLLQGNPQEHRNMPLDDAVKLIAHNFFEFIQSRKEKMDRERSEAGPYGGYLPPDREIQYLLNQLADGRFLTVAELDRVIGYLRDRKDQLAGITTSTTLTTATTSIQNNDQSVALKQQELQQKIFSIIGQTPTPTAENINLGLKAQATVGQSTGIGQSLDIQQRQTSQQSSTYINFDNPNVKKALDNLIQTGPKLLESIGMTSAGSQDASSALIQSPNLLRGSLGGQMTSGAGTGMANLGSMGSMGLQNDYTGTLSSPNLGLNKNIGFSDQLGMSSQTNQLMGTNLSSQIRGNTGMNADRSFGLTGSLQQTSNLNKNLGTQFHGGGINMERNLNLSSSLSQGTGGGNRNLGTNLSNTRGSNINSQGSRPNAPNNNFQNNSNLMRGVSGARHPLLGTQMGNQSLHGRGGRF
ncbi:nuclear receptor coactivator 5-like isoform X2 [Centruroides vittatus]|uniref:nuclear receptor coactivator 5-like isoform X2 n=1 Tax=Centruroides vittatus TaxID=120091 RepID=UPI00350F29AA